MVKTSLQVEWKGQMVFEGHPPSGVSFTMDSHPDHGGEGKGPTPVEALLSALAACTAMDVVSILQKKKQVLTAYTIDVEGEREPIGEWPRPFKKISLKHNLRGVGLDPIAVARAIELSDEKYCTVMSTMKYGPEISTSWEIAEPAVTG